MTTEFRDAIAAQVHSGPYARLDADAILVLPEMQAIRRALATRALSELNLTWRGYAAADRRVETILRSWGLPESVITWMRGDDDEQ